MFFLKYPLHNFINSPNPSNSIIDTDMPIVIPERYKPFNDILFFVAVSNIKLKIC